MTDHGTTSRRLCRRLVLALLALVVLAATPASAQLRGGLIERRTPAAEAEQPPAEEAAPAPIEGTSVDEAADPTSANSRVDAWQGDLREIRTKLETAALDEQELVSLRARANEIATTARDLEGRLEPQLRAAEARLQQLGPAPDDGTRAEPEELQQRREAEQAELSRTDTALKNTRLIAVEAEQLALDISATRRDRMTQRLTARGPSALSGALWREAVADGAGGLGQLATLVSSTAGLLAQGGIVGPFLTLGLALLLALGGRMLVRGLALRYDVHEREGEEQPVSRKLIRSAVITLSVGVLPNLLLFGLFLVMIVYGVLPEQLAQVVRGLFTGIGAAIFVFALARAFFAPHTPRWRLLTLSDGAASALSFHVTSVGIVLGAAIVFQNLNNVLVGAVSLDIARRVMMAFLIVLFFALALRRLALEWSIDEESDREPHPLSVLLRMFIWTVLALIVGALILGYVPLASFLAVQLVFMVTVLALLWLLLGVIDDVITNYVRPGQPAGRALQAGFGLSSGGVKQIAVLSSGVLRLALIVFAAMLVLVPWGFEADRWTAWLRAAFFGFQVGEVTFSLSSILTAVLLLVVGIAATRGIQSWLTNRYLPNTRLDVGMRNSIRTMFGYVGVIAAAVFAFGYLGLNLENVALLAGALSVGIGFGLQSIVNNFVSGIILLAERPIKEGDWIVVGAEQGYVRKISIRATEIETFDRGTVIVPNSDLITGTVKNWTHSSMIGRVDISVNVAYGTSTKHVHDLMLSIARDHRSVLYFPEPSVLFWNFGEGAHTFRLWAFIGDINYVYNVASDLRFEIERRFAEEGIVIPFPQRDISIRDITRIEAALAARRPDAAGGTGSAGEDGAT